MGPLGGVLGLRLVEAREVGGGPREKRSGVIGGSLVAPFSLVLC